MVKWAVELSEFDIEFRLRPTIKAQVLANFIVEMAHDEASILAPTWSLYVDGSSTAIGSGAGIVLESPQGDKLEYTTKLEFPASNNEAEYEALLAGGELALAVGAKKIVVYSDSQLVVNQIQGSYEARGEKIAKYLLKAKELFDKFEESSLIQMSRADNGTTDQLAKIASSMAAIRNRRITFILSDRAAVEQQVEILCTNPPPTSWKEDIMRFLTQGTTSGDPKEARAMRVKAARFVMIDGGTIQARLLTTFPKMSNSRGGKLRVARNERRDLWKPPRWKNLSRKSRKTRLLLADDAPRCPGNGQTLSCMPRACKY
ncbi:UNVERIFIED_CONTAM: Ribonuclease HI [Sesamum latifolium]|uniref:Ribonuclease HI n=1 Tax=Sesamum latifolium TaxID=2727402 RepID=A0AAW2U518_9LAMI